MRLGLGLLAVLVVAAVAAPLAAGWLGHDPALPDLFNRFAAPSAGRSLSANRSAV